MMFLINMWASQKAMFGPYQTYPEEERPCLSKYWNGKIYFTNREISLALILYVWNKPFYSCGLVAMNGSEATGDLVFIQTFLLFL